MFHRLQKYLNFCISYAIIFLAFCQCFIVIVKNAISIFTKGIDFYGKARDSTFRFNQHTVKKILDNFSRHDSGRFAGLLLCNKYGNPTIYSSTKYLVDTAILSDDTGSSANIEEQRNNVLSKLMASTYIEILNTRMFTDYLAELLEESDLSVTYSSAQLFNMIKYSYEENTETYMVTVTAFSPEDAKIISQCIQNESENYLVSKKTNAVETLQVIDRAWENKNPSNVNVLVAVILGLMIGAVIPSLIFFIIEMNDSRIKDEKSISNTFNLPVLGSIPEYSIPSKKQQSVDE